jgi:CarD family transcriptional regulator
VRDFGGSHLSIDRPGDDPVPLLAAGDGLERAVPAVASNESAAEITIAPDATSPDATSPDATSPDATSLDATSPGASSPETASHAVAFEDLRPFRKGDLVVYPSHGIGMVDHVRVEDIGGQKLNWIKISFAENRMSLRIPVRKAKDVGLRRPATRQAFTEVMAILRGRPRINRIVWTKRAQEYQEKINSGSVRALAEVVRDLRPSLDGSESSFSRRNLFEMAVDRLATEFAAVFRMDKAAAIVRLIADPPAVARVAANPPAG